MALNTLANSLLPTGTLAVVSAKTGAYEAGLLGIMLQLYFLIGLGLTIANQVLSPPVASLFAARHLDQLEWLLQRIARLAFAICAALAFTVIVFGKPLLTLIYSADYAQLAGPLSLLALSQVFSASVGSPGVVMLMTGHQNALLLITVFSVALAIVVSSLLVTDYKIWGVAIGISMSQVSQNVSMVLFVFLRLRVRTWLSLRPVSAASAELGSVNRRE